MNCPNCGGLLELDSLEYLMRGSGTEAKASFSCAYCHQLWVKVGNELVRAISLIQLEPPKRR